MRQVALVVAVAGLLVGTLATPALADRGEEFTETAVFADVDPCTGETHTVTLELSLVAHQHGAITAIYWTGEASTTLGYVGSGSGKYVANSNMEVHHERASWTNTNPETGHAFTVEVTWMAAFGEPTTPDEMIVVCLTA